MNDLPLDIARMLLYQLDDIDLINTCKTDRYYFYKVCDKDFWIKIIRERYNLSMEDIKPYSHNRPLWIYFINIVKHIRNNPSPGDLLLIAAETDRVDLLKIAYNKFTKEGYILEYEALKYALNAASAKGNMNAVKFLVSTGIDIDYTSALINAAENQHLSVLSFLIESGADVHGDEDEIFSKASSLGHNEVIKILLGAGADINARDGEFLYMAISGNHPETVKLLLDAGADIQLLNEQDKAMILRRNNPKIIRLLLQAGLRFD